jgi:hypothetical protein
MKIEDIPAFVEEVAATGCNITGIAGAGYLIGDSDLAYDQFEEVMPKLKAITDADGKRDHLLGEIIEYLVSIGRSFPPPEGTSPQGAALKRSANGRLNNASIRSKPGLPDLALVILGIGILTVCGRSVPRHALQRHDDGSCIPPSLHRTVDQILHRQI